MAAVEKVSEKALRVGAGEVVDGRGRRRPGQHHRAAPAAVAGHQDLGGGARLGEGQLAVQVEREVAAEGGQQQHAEHGAEQRDQEDLPEAGAPLQPEDVDRRHGEDRAAGDDPGGGADGQHVDVLQQRRGPAQGARQHRGEPHGEDGDGDGRLDPLPQLERDVGGGGGEDRRPDHPLHDGARRDLGRRGAGRHQRQVGLARLERAEGVLGEAGRRGARPGLGCVVMVACSSGRGRLVALHRREPEVGAERQRRPPG